MDNIQQRSDKIEQYQQQKLHYEKSLKVKAFIALSGIFIALAALAAFAILSYLTGGLLPLGIVVYALAGGAGLGVISALGANLLLVESKCPALPSANYTATEKASTQNLVLTAINSLGATAPSELYIEADSTLGSNTLGSCLMAYRAEKKLASRMLRDSSEQTLENLNHIVQLHNCYSLLDPFQRHTFTSPTQTIEILRAIWESDPTLFESDDSFDDMTFVIIDKCFESQSTDDPFMELLLHHENLALTYSSSTSTTTSAIPLMQSIKMHHCSILHGHLLKSIDTETEFPEEEKIERIYIYSILYILKNEIIEFYNNYTTAEDQTAEDLDFFFKVACFCCEIDDVISTSDRFDCANCEEDLVHYLKLLSEKQHLDFKNRIDSHMHIAEMLQKHASVSPLEYSEESASKERLFPDLYRRIQKTLCSGDIEDSSGYSIEEVDEKKD